MCPPRVISYLLRVGRSIDVNIRFLFLGLGGWIYHGGVTLFFLCGWVHDCGVTFFLLGRRVRDRGFLLFTSGEQRHANQQTNTFFHTDESYFSGHFVVPAWAALLKPTHWNGLVRFFSGR